eukprot:767660-Prorocentrum_minimum.AAC.6
MWTVVFQALRSSVRASCVDRNTRKSYFHHSPGSASHKRHTSVTQASHRTPRRTLGFSGRARSFEGVPSVTFALLSPDPDKSTGSGHTLNLRGGDPRDRRRVRPVRAPGPHHAGAGREGYPRVRPRGADPVLLWHFAGAQQVGDLHLRQPGCAGHGHLPVHQQLEVQQRGPGRAGQDPGRHRRDPEFGHGGRARCLLQLVCALHAVSHRYLS